MRHAEKVVFVEDENGWELHVTDEDGQTERFNIHGLAWNLVDHMNDTIGDWRHEGLAAVGLSSSPPAALTAEEQGVHPLAHLVRSGAADLARDAERGK